MLRRIREGLRADVPDGGAQLGSQSGDVRVHLDTQRKPPCQAGQRCTEVVSVERGRMETTAKAAQFLLRADCSHERAGVLIRDAAEQTGHAMQATERTVLEGARESAPS